MAASLLPSLTPFWGCPVVKCSSDYQNDTYLEMSTEECRGWAEGGFPVWTMRGVFSVES